MSSIFTPPPCLIHTWKAWLRMLVSRIRSSLPPSCSTRLENATVTLSSTSSLPIRTTSGHRKVSSPKASHPVAVAAGERVSGRGEGPYRSAPPS